MDYLAQPCWCRSGLGKDNGWSYEEGGAFSSIVNSPYSLVGQNTLRVPVGMGGGGGVRFEVIVMNH